MENYYSYELIFKNAEENTMTLKYREENDNFEKLMKIVKGRFWFYTVKDSSQKKILKRFLVDSPTFKLGF